MHGDISRSTFDPSRRYAGVRMQQGRVQLDSDWNEQLDIQARRDRAAMIDAVGEAAGPVHDCGFGLKVSPDSSDLLVEPGRYWVRGVLCEAATDQTPVISIDGARVALGTVVLDGSELAAGSWVRLWDNEGNEIVSCITSVDAATRTLELSPEPDLDRAWAMVGRRWSYRCQPDLPYTPERGTGLEEPLADQLLHQGDHLVYLDVWERPITALEDPGIQEVALGGADTATRTKTVWQLWLLWLPDGWREDLEPGEDLEERKPTGTMAARTHADAGGDNLCAPVAGGGYSGAENQLYRVQIRSVDDDQHVTSIVWSRDNGSVTTGLTGAGDGVLEVMGIGRDPVLGFTSGQWVELLDDARELRQIPGTLVKLEGAEGNHLTLISSSADGPIDFAAFGGGHAKVRRWDCQGAVSVTTEDWVDIEHGIQVRFSDGTYCEGDFWLIPARTAIADIDWPQSGSHAGPDSGLSGEASRPPEGVEHSYAPIAVIRAGEGGLEVVEDLRTRFPALSDLTSAHIGHRRSDRIPGARTLEEAIEFLARRVIELEQHVASLHPDRPQPQGRRGWR